MSDKPKWPRAQALAVAEEIVAALKPVTQRAEIAGSIRRQKAQVGDVEIVYVPRIEEQTDAASLFGDRVLVNMVDETLARLQCEHVLARRTNINGVEMFGQKNKLMLHVASRIPVDLFATTEASWFNYLVCRTGGAETNVAICNAAIAKGWKWTPYGEGFTRIGYTQRMRSEHEVFEFVGLPYLPPENRI